MSRRKWLCLDCKTDTGKAGEHYFLRDDVWSSAGMGKVGMLCIGCAEERIGRTLSASDFTKCYINDPKRNRMSTRLLSRITA